MSPAPAPAPSASASSASAPSASAASPQVISPDLIRLLRCDLFDEIDPVQLAPLLQRVQLEAVPAHHQLITQGDEADAFFVLLGGTLEVWVEGPDGDNLQIATLAPGQAFGEQALLTGARGRRSASVRSATTPARVARFPAAVLDALLQQGSDLERRLRALGATYAQDDLVRRSALMRALLAARPEPAQRTLAPGEVLFRRGDPDDGLFLVLRGEVGLYDDSGDQPVRCAVHGPGLSVGEEQGPTRARTAIAEQASRLLHFPRADLAVIAQRAEDRRAGAHAQLTTLAYASSLPQRGYLRRYLSARDGLTCLSQVYDLEGGRQLVSSHVLGREAIHLEVPGAAPGTPLTTPDGALELELDAQGQLLRVSARSRSPLVAELFGRAVEGRPLSVREQRQLRRTGALPPPGDRPLCACLRVQRAQIDDAIAQGARTLAALQRETGAGLGCGTCLADLEACLGGLWRAVTVIGTEPLGPGVTSITRLRLSQDTGNTAPGTRLPVRDTAGRTHLLFTSRAGLLLPPGLSPGDTLELGPPDETLRWEAGPAPLLCLTEGSDVTLALAIVEQVVAQGWPHRVVALCCGISADQLPTALAQPPVPNVTVETHSGPPPMERLRAWLRRFPSALSRIHGSARFCDGVARALRDAGQPAHRQRCASPD